MTTTKDVILNYMTLAKVFDSISDFKRTMELLPAFKEMKDVAEYYEIARQKIVKAHTVEGKEFEPTQQFQDEIMKLLDTELTIKRPLKFTESEVETAKIKNSELLNIYEHFMLCNQSVSTSATQKPQKVKRLPA